MAKGYTKCLVENVVWEIYREGKLVRNVRVNLYEVLFNPSFGEHIIYIMETQEWVKGVNECDHHEHHILETNDKLTALRKYIEVIDRYEELRNATAKQLEEADEPF